MGSHVRVVPTVVIHGDADQIVAPINGDQLVQQWLTANHLSGARDLGGTLAQPTQRESDAVRGGHRYSTARWLDPTGRVLLEYLRVEALGHAWSGGSAGEAYSDPRGPSASEALWRFFARACVRLPRSEPVRRQGDP
jgi:poly(3-hydroxybutyrate) depolymerase